MEIKPKKMLDSIYSFEVNGGRLESTGNRREPAAVEDLELV